MCEYTNLKDTAGQYAKDDGDDVLECYLLFLLGNNVDFYLVMIWSVIDLNDGQFSERCDVNGSFFNSDAIPIIFGKA